MWLRLVIALALSGLLVGCPQKTQNPMRTAGMPCTTLDDCVPDGGVECGELLDCVDQVCAGSPSIVRPCP